MERPIAGWDPRRHLQSKPVLWTVVFLGVGIVGALDFLTGTEASFALFYLFPVSIAAWWIGTRAGIVCSVVSSAIWYLANDLAGQQYSSVFLPFWNGSIRLVFFLIVTLLLVRIHSMLQREKSLSRVDFLTGAYNVRAFHEIAGAECVRAGRYPQPLTLAFIDLDRFKQVNDRYGHQEGDKVLQVVAQTLKEGIRGADTLARLGGDEFALLLPQTDQESARTFLPRLREQLLAAMQRNKWDVTFSIGALTCPTAPAALSDAMGEADELMYEMKRAGRNDIRYGVYAGPAQIRDALAAAPTPEKGSAAVVASAADS